LCAKGPNAGVVSSNGLRGINQREEMPFVGAVCAQTTSQQV
ncbi:MAG: hypothetical protein ACI9OU_002632, partial [Candidatus Promineifilaceae bacterium]